MDLAVGVHPHRRHTLSRYLVALALAAAFLLSASTTATPAHAAGPLAAGQQAVVSADGDCLRLRSMPSLVAAELDCVDDGTVVTARGAQYQADGLCWEAVTHDGLNGWMAAMYLDPVGGSSDDGADPCADAASTEDQEDEEVTTPSPGEPGVLPVPPPDGWTSGVAGTSDIEALIEAQTFDVASVWMLDVAAQEYQSYLVGAPDFVNEEGLPNLGPDSVVLMRRTGDKPGNLGEPAAAPADEAPRGVANVLPTPPADKFTIGVSGTNDPAVLAASQPFEVKLVAMLDVPSQQWLTYSPGAPDWVQSLARGQLREDSIVWLRAGAVSTPTPTATPTPTPTATPEPTATTEPEGEVVEARVTYFYCRQGTIAAGIGDGGDWCGAMANGEIVHEGAAACSRENFGQRFRIIGDPLDRTYTCKDTGGAVHGEHRDIWFENSDDGFNWSQQVGDYAQVEILPDE